MSRILLFGGTTEGRKLSEFLAEAGVDTLVCTATEYGGELSGARDAVRVHAGRLNEEEIERLLASEEPELVVDATHPYAKEVTANVKAACEAKGREYLRVLREGLAADGDAGIVYVGTAEDALAYVKKREGNVLLTIGSHEIDVFGRHTSIRDRLVARVLPQKESLEACLEAGIRPANLIMMQGPFTRELNEAVIRQYGCRFLVTKQTGPAGGYEEKIAAALAAGAVPVVIGAPEEEEGLPYFEALGKLCGMFGIRPQQYVALVGAGMGSRADLTAEGAGAIDEAELVIGAGRLLELAGGGGRTVLNEYDPEKICAYIKDHPQYRQIVVLLSGDPGFYSGARRLSGKLAEIGCRVFRIPGVSSLSYFMSRLQMAWDDVQVVSNHGRKRPLVPLIRDNEKVFSLLGGDGDVRELAEDLLAHGLDDVRMYVGERLSYDDEKIASGTPEDFKDHEGDGLSVVLLVNRRYEETALSASRTREDGEFVRGDVPMTKRQIRALSLDLLDIGQASVCWDVGAGTGSVSVEMALRAPEGRVIAVEKSVDAADLIRENRRKFMTENVEVIPGGAPEVLESLPAPDRVFIGGTSGRMAEIVAACMKKNPAARVVIDCIALESAAEAAACAYGYSDAPEILQVRVDRGRRAGEHTMMTGTNPITIVAFTGRGTPEEEEEA